MRALSNLRPDGFTIALVAIVLLATVLPCRGDAVPVFELLAKLAIALLFFMQGARLTREAVVQGLLHWRLHLLILGFTFGVFPLLGLAVRQAFPGLLSDELWLGVLFVCVLPSTVQSSIAFTSIGKGNVAAAVCSATASNILGVVLTPFLMAAILHLGGGELSLLAVWKVVLQLLVPFCAGQLARGMIRDWVERNRRLLGVTDRGSILLVVYVAFSESVVQGIWGRLELQQLVALVLVSTLLLTLMLTLTAWVSRCLGFSRSDRVAIVFCSSKKSLATGIPIAKVLLAGPMLGMLVLPLIIFHQLQMLICAWLASRHARSATSSGGG